MALFDFFRFSLLRRNFKELEILEIIFLSHIIISCLFWKNGNIEHRIQLKFLKKIASRMIQGFLSFCFKIPTFWGIMQDFSILTKKF